MKPLVSVIVAIYNAEPYLRQCIDSLVGQIYDPLEIILVDNASADGSWDICREYAEKDRRIRLIRLDENYGCGGGRNAGIAAATGEYIGFADADDLVDPDMYSYLVSNAVRFDSDITICGFYEEDGRNARKECVPILTQYSGEDALRELLSDRIIRNYLWQKLFKARLFSGFSLPERCAYDDLAIYRAFREAAKVVCLPEAKYHYRIRSSSDCHRIIPSVYVNRADLFIRRAEDLMTTHPHLRAYVVNDIYSAFSLYYQAAGRFPDHPALLRALGDEHLQKLRAAKKDIIDCNGLGFLGRLELSAMCRGSKLDRLLAPRIHEFTVFVIGLRRTLRGTAGSP